ncbi:hypothetical protein HDU78_003658 [Chytriomyces hyalinus]|nr:hypothetical protein HDU78_003658 [Chytriomyces hyalinus]
MTALLIQHGISPKVLNSELDFIVGQPIQLVGQPSDFMLRLFLEPGVDPSYQDNVLLVESLGNVTYNVTYFLLKDDRVSLASNDYRAVKMALDMSKMDHVQLFLEVAETGNDLEPLRIVEEYLGQSVPMDFTHALHAVIDVLAETAI